MHMWDIDLLTARTERLGCAVRDNRQTLVTEDRIPYFDLNVGKELIL